MWWRRRAYESAFSALLAENSDLRQQLRIEREAHSHEVKDLLDRVLSVENPQALREMRRPREPDSPFPKAHRQSHIHFPGFGPYLRPPSPPQPPSASTAPPLTDQQISAVINSDTDKES